MSVNEVGLADTVILYTTVEQALATNVTPTTGTNAPQVDYWALKVLPRLSIFDHPIFNTFYGEVVEAQGITHYFSNFRPQLSPNGRYLLLPGIGGYTPPDSDSGAGLWLADLEGDTLHQLLPQAQIATWNPTSDTIAYVEGETLFTLALAEGATPTPLFSHPNLWGLYAHWSPDGRWIASATTVQGEPDAQGSPELTNTYWLIPADGGSPQELAVKQDFAMEYTTGEMAWSPNGQLLMMRNEVFNLTGEKVGTGFPGRANWLPDQAQLLVNGQDGLRLMTLDGEEIVSINDTFTSAWAFSHDGQQLAYSQPDDDGQTALWIFDLATHENQFVCSLVADNVSPLRWSSDDKHLIVGGVQDNNSLIWTIEVKPNSSAVSILENALLVEVIGNISP